MASFHYIAPSIIAPAYCKINVKNLKGAIEKGIIVPSKY
jgi:hypothetical protein